MEVMVIVLSVVVLGLLYEWFQHEEMISRMVSILEMQQKQIQKLEDDIWK
jgi:hypothetical protein